MMKKIRMFVCAALAVLILLFIILDIAGGGERTARHGAESADAGKEDTVDVTDAIESEGAEDGEVVVEDTASSSKSSNEDTICDEEYMDVLKKAEKMGLVPDSYYGSDLTQKMTRADFMRLCVVFYEDAAGVAVEPASSATFTDTTDTYVLKAYSLGLISGYTDETGSRTFDPAGDMDRETAARLFYAACMLALPGEDFTADYSKQFTDHLLISSSCADAVYYLSGKGIMPGYTEYIFGPNNSSIYDYSFTYYGYITYQEGLSILYNAEDILL